MKMLYFSFLMYNFANFELSNLDTYCPSINCPSVKSLSTKSLSTMIRRPVSNGYEHSNYLLTAAFLFHDLFYYITILFFDR